jgi:hypothetical protein
MVDLREGMVRLEGCDTGDRAGCVEFTPHLQLRERRIVDGTNFGLDDVLAQSPPLVLGKLR